MISARLRRYFVVVAGVGAGTWLIGLLLFVMIIAHISEPALTTDVHEADAIVVLTGGSERVTTGIELLRAGKGKKLFISGVYPGLSLDQVLGSQTVPQNFRDCCIMLGHTAESTMGNAEETLTWMKLEGYHSLLLVTANYHMPRSLLIFRAALPGIAIFSYPVVPGSVKFDSWWARPGTASLLVTEYNKYLWARFRLMLDET